MTREEARERLNNIKWNHATNPCPDREALDMAIEALKQEPCEDCISRKYLLNAFGLSEKSRKYNGDHSGYDTRMLYEIQDVIEEAPPVQPNIKDYNAPLCEDVIHGDFSGVMDKE